MIHRRFWLTQSAAVLLSAACVLAPRAGARGLDRIAASTRRLQRSELPAESANAAAVPWRVGGIVLLVLALATVARNV